MFDGKEAVVAIQATAGSTGVGVGKDALVDGVVEDAVADNSPLTTGTAQAVEAVRTTDTCIARVGGSRHTL
jgi:hypothetical protein